MCPTASPSASPHAHCAGSTVSAAGMLVTGSDPRLPFDRRELAQLLATMLNCVALPDPANVRLELVCLSDGEMATLNAAAMGCCGPTNVLSFPDGEGGFLGSLALSVDTVERESLVYGLSPAVHCRRLLAHGIAHVLGYDHGPDMDALCSRMSAA